QRLGAHESLERLGIGIGLARQMHHGEDSHLVAEELLVEQRTIAFDVASLLECAHAAQTGRSRDADAARKLDVGDAPIFLQLLENLLVNGIQTGGQGKDSGRFAKCSRQLLATAGQTCETLLRGGKIPPGARPLVSQSCGSWSA